jgi:sugar (pentulose or hexulose) kinase
MERVLLIGLDLGTSHVKAAAFRPDGQRVAEAAAAYPTHYPLPGWAEQSPADWEAAIAAALQALLVRLGPQTRQVAALALSCHAPGLVPVDAQGLPLLERVPIWQDERSMEHARRLLQAIGPDWVGLGMPFASFPAKLCWFIEAHPAAARRAAFALGVKAYLIHWLTGRYATDPSSEPGASPAWQSLCAECGWSLDRLAPTRPAAEVVGGLLAERAQAFGLSPDLPIVLGLNDGASATLGNGALQPGEAVVTLGTNGVLYLVSGQPISPSLRLDQALFCWPYVEGRFIVGGQTKCGAASLQWLSGLLQGANAAFDTMLLESAGQAPGSHGVTFLPYLMGQGTPHDDPAATGGFLGLTLATKRADLVLAVLEGVAFTLRDVLEALAGLHPIAPQLGLTGGGARSPLWRQVVADVLNRRLDYAEGDSLLGAAMMAAIGLGLYPSTAEACQAMRRSGEEVAPRPPQAEGYERLYGEFCRRRDALLAAR